MAETLVKLPPALRNRFLYLRNREAFAAVVLSILIPLDWINRSSDIMWELRVPALFLFGVILLEGTLYWHLKLRSLEERTPLPAGFSTLFTVFKWFNAGGIAVVLAATVWLRDDATSQDIGWTLILLAAAGLEQINYFYYQLMYDTRAAFDYLRRNKRLRRAALGLDIERSK
jgi:hypothetical protein